MIREAPQPQQARQTGLIELPIVEVHSNSHTPTSTMPSSVVPPPSFVRLAQNTNANLNLNLNQQTKTQTISNQKANRTTIVQIPKQSSRPRIFLLTRPAKPSLVRIVNPRVQHREKDLNTIAHHPQVKNGSEFLKTSKIKTIIPIRSNQTEAVLKKDLLQAPQEDTQYPKITGYNTPQLKRKLKDSLISNQEIIVSSSRQVLSPQTPSPVTGHKQISIKQISVKQTSDKQQTSVKQQTKQLPETTVQAHYNLVKTTTEIETKKEQSLQAAQMPMTLASMAGIELTGADMSHTAADMSGAMPPTATVEEINVPVFLDEYLLQAAAISTSAAPVTTTTTTNSNNQNNINNNNNNHIIYNNSNNSNNNISNYTESAGEVRSEAETAATEVEVQNGNNDSQHCLETFDNFEFDIDLLTENRNSDDGDDYNDNQDKALELQLLQRQQQIEQQQKLLIQHQQQQQPQQTQKQFINDNSDQEVKEEKQKQQLQLMLDELLFINNNNNYDNNKILNTNNNNSDTTIPNTFKMISDLSDNYAGEIEDIFKVGPNSPLFEDNLSPPLDLGATTTSSPTMENIDDFIPNDSSNNANSASYFLNSQPNVVMFSAGIPISAPSSQNLNHSSFLEELLDAEPNTPPDMINYPYAAEASCLSGYFVFGDSTPFIDEDTMDFNSEELPLNPLKRSHSNAAITPKHMQEKRLKLRLDIKPSKENENQSQELNTPAIINSILQNDEFNTCVMSPAENSTDIYNRLINSPYESIDKSEIDTGEYADDITPPYTPYSLNSTSQQTNFTGIINSAPSSPASSIATTNATTSTSTAAAARRGRGRPAKVHSDRPDLSRIQSEADRKKALKRYKNNEASRKSRLKNKERDMALEHEEKEQSMRSKKLELDFQTLKKVERKLRQALKRQHFRGYTH